MRILWVVSQILPDVAEKLKVNRSGFGGWVNSMLQRLKSVQNIELIVAACSNQVKEIVRFETGNIKYCVLPIVGKNKNVNRDDCRRIISEYKPDLIHIEGTEFAISERFSEMSECTNLVSLQGIINAYEPYQYGDLPIADFMFSISLSKLITGWSLFFRKHLLFNCRLKTERNTIANADNIMGRTLWDRAHSYVFNRKANYYSCNRILRPSFYKRLWQYEKCNKHSIFVGNGYSALKGGHVVIRAVKLLAEEYPDITLNFAGADPYIHSHRDAKKKIGYSYYLRHMLRDSTLKHRVRFLGEQNEKKMADELIKTNVYVLSSIIENSPNTLGEAMIMGVPCVSAYTGGAAEMAADEKEALIYRAGDAEMLAWQIKRVFDMKDKVSDMCRAAREHALITHDPDRNLEALVSAYKAILKEEKSQ